LWDKWEVEQNDSGLLFDVRDYESPEKSEKIRFLISFSEDIRKKVEQLSALCEEQDLKKLPSLRSLWISQPQQERNKHGASLPSWLSNRTPTVEVKREEKKQKKARVAGERRVFRVGGIYFAMRWIPAGRFLMGARVDDAGAWENEKPLHEVTISRGFWMSETPVTQRQYQAITGENPSYFEEAGLDAPVEQVSWYDVAEFANKISALEGLSPCFQNNSRMTAMDLWMRAMGLGDEAGDYLGCKGWRLPTEAEWEYAARAGTTTPRYGELDEIAWYWANCGETTHAVGQKQANAWGLHDTLGNVLEWCYDGYGKYSSNTVFDPVQSATSDNRVLRGGGWDGVAQIVRVAYRYSSDPSFRTYYVGFRLVRSGADEEIEEPFSLENPEAQQESSSKYNLNTWHRAFSPETPEALQESNKRGVPLPAWLSNSQTVMSVKREGRDQKSDDLQHDALRSLLYYFPNTQIVRVTPLESEEQSAGERRIFRVGEVDFAMRWIPAGRFLMGAGADDKEAFEDEKPQHEVTLTRGFWIGETPVTQGQYQAIMGRNPSDFKKAGLDAPVECVSWYDAAAFANKLSALEGLSACFVESNKKRKGVVNGASDYLGCKGWRLPTEAEWEYACRAGTPTPRYGELDEIAWYGDNSGKTTHPVRQKEANAWGLHDLLGNVWEWCYDRYRAYPKQAATDPVGAATGTHSVRRGGSWYHGAQWVRAADRFRSTPTTRDYKIGFRVVRSGD
jgi:formylglycine-generating enzyme required for sulfatase activity